MADQLVQPPFVVPLSDEYGHASTAWLQFFASLVAPPPLIAEVDMSSGSPYSFIASRPGHLLIQGGTVSAITLTRGRDTVALTAIAGFIPVGQADIIETTFAVLPDAWFIPFQ